jgi:flavin-dependent dehydrogenase
MDIAIVGAGVAGSSIYRLLQLYSNTFKGTVDLYSVRETQPCGIHPCAWMTHGITFSEMMDILRIPADRYTIRNFSEMDFDGHLISCDLRTIRKPAFLRDLQGMVNVRYEPVNPDAYDVVVDCTGVARALLPPVQGDLIAPTLQYRVRRNTSSPEVLLPRIRFVRSGYAWSFPLDRTHLHIGVGSLQEDLGTSLNMTGFLGNGDIVECQCRSSVRVGTPQNMQPAHHGNIWGVGESIGTVSPLVGDGIVPSIQCACRFVGDLLEGSLDKYPGHVLTDFAWMEEERMVINRMIARDGQIGLRDLMLMRDHASRFGLYPGLRWAFSWVLGNRFSGIF